MANILECDKCHCLSRGTEPGIENFTHIDRRDGEDAKYQGDLYSKCLKEYKGEMAALGKKYGFVIKEEE